jgi:diguanylate cyclase (GGDEF)-like protein
MDQQTLRVLLVEDDDVDRTVVKRAFAGARLHAEFAIATTMQSARELLESQEFDILLLDYSLPDGESLTLIAAYQRYPIIVLTSLDSDDIVSEAFRLGAEDYLIKGTYTDDVLRRTVLHAIQRHRLRAELEQTKRKLEKLSQHDELTEAYNRRGVTGLLLRMLQRGENVIAVLIDLDDFKHVNDTYGHSTGDKVLVSVTQALQTLARPRDLVGRLGGDEFVVILPDMNMMDAVTAAQRYLEGIRGIRVKTRKGTVRITGSIGVVKIRSTEAVESVTALLERTEAALAQAKSGGKDTVCAVQ